MSNGRKEGDIGVMRKGAREEDIFEGDCYIKRDARLKWDEGPKALFCYHRYVRCLSLRLCILRRLIAWELQSLGKLLKREFSIQDSFVTSLRSETNPLVISLQRTWMVSYILQPDLDHGESLEFSSE